MGEPALKGESREGGASHPTRTRYEDDLYTWVQEQVAFLRAGRVDALDLEHIAEELEGVSKSEFAKLQSALRVLVMHMLKWDQQPEHRTPSWIFSIREQRRRYGRVLQDNPGLKPRIHEALGNAYPDARDWASDETHLPPDEFPSECPYTWDDILNRPFDFDSVKKQRP
jgi:predicted DNA-binding ribbon-helix-helix protein